MIAPLRGPLAALLLITAAACSPEAPGSLPAPVEPLARCYFARLDSEGYVETVPLAEASPQFLLAVRPRIRTPAEGPWRAVFRSPGAEETWRHEGLRVDPATGQLTFLCQAARFSAGDWRLTLELEEGGMTAGQKVREYRFTVR